MLPNYSVSYLTGYLSNGRWTIPSRSADGDTARNLDVLALQVRMPFGFVGRVQYGIRLSTRRKNWNSQWVYTGFLTVEDLEIPWPTSQLLPFEKTLAFGAWTSFVLNVSNVTGLTDVSVNCSEDITVTRHDKWITRNNYGVFHIASMSEASVVSWNMTSNRVARTVTSINCTATTASVDIPSHTTSFSWSFNYLPTSVPIVLATTAMQFSVGPHSSSQLNLSALFTDYLNVGAFNSSQCSMSWNASQIEAIELDHVAVHSSFQQFRQPNVNCSQNSTLVVVPALGFFGYSTVVLLVSNDTTVKPFKLQFKVQVPLPSPPSVILFSTTLSASYRSTATLIILEATVPPPCILQLQLPDIPGYRFRGQWYQNVVISNVSSIRQQPLTIQPPPTYISRQVVNLIVYSLCPDAQTMAVSTQLVLNWLQASPPSLTVVSDPSQLFFATNTVFVNVSAALHPLDMHQGILALDVTFNSSVLHLNNQATMLTPTQFRLGMPQSVSVLAFTPTRYFSGAITVTCTLTSSAYDTFAISTSDWNGTILPVASKPLAKVTATTVLRENDVIQLLVAVDSVMATGYTQASRTILILETSDIASVANLTCSVVSSRLYCPLTPGFVARLNQSVVLTPRKYLSGSMNVSTLTITSINTPLPCLGSVLTPQGFETCCQKSLLCSAAVDQTTLYVQGIPQPPELDVTPTRLSSSIQGTSWVFIKRVALTDPSQKLDVYVTCPVGVLRKVTQTRDQWQVSLPRANVFTTAFDGYQVQLSGPVNSMGIQLVWQPMPPTVNFSCSIQAVVTDPLEGANFTALMSVAVQLAQTLPLVQLPQTYFELDEGTPFVLPIIADKANVASVVLDCPPKLCANISWPNGSITRSAESTVILAGDSLRNGSFVVTLIKYTTGILPFTVTAIPLNRASSNQSIPIQVVVRSLPTLPLVDIAPKVYLSVSSYVAFQVKITPLDPNDQLVVTISVPSQSVESLWSPGWMLQSTNDTVNQYAVNASSANQSTWQLQGLLVQNLTRPFMIDLFVSSTEPATKLATIRHIALTIVPNMSIANVLSIQSEEDALIPIPLASASQLWDMDGDILSQVWISGQSRRPQPLVNTTVLSYNISKDVTTVYIQNKFHFSGLQTVYVVGDDGLTQVNIVVKPKTFTAQLSLPSRSTMAISIAAQTSVQLSLPRVIPVSGTVGLKYLGPQGPLRLYLVLQSAIQLRVSSAYVGVFHLSLQSGGGYQVAFDVRIFPLAAVPWISNASSTVVVNATQTSVVLAPQSFDDIMVVDAKTSAKYASPLTLQWPQYQTSNKSYFAVATSTEVASSTSRLTVSTATRVVGTTVLVVSQPVAPTMQLEPLRNISVFFPAWYVYWNESIACRFQVQSPDTTGNQYLRFFATMNTSQIQLVRYNQSSVNVSVDSGGSALAVVEILAKPSTFFLPWTQLEVVPRAGFVGDLRFALVVRSIVRESQNSVDTVYSWSVTVIPTATAVSLQLFASKSKFLETESVVLNSTVGVTSAMENLSMAVFSSMPNNIATVQPVNLVPNQPFSLQTVPFWFGVFDVVVNATVQHKTASPRDKAITSRSIRVEIVPVAYPPVLLAPSVVPSAPNTWSNLSITQFVPFVQNRTVPLETMKLYLRVLQLGLSLKLNNTVLKVTPNVLLEIPPTALVMGSGGIFNVTFSAIHRIPSSNTSAITSVDQTLYVAGISVDFNASSIVEGQGMLLSVALKSPSQVPVTLVLTCSDFWQRVALSATNTTVVDTTPWNVALATTRDYVDHGDLTVNCSVQIQTSDPFFSQVDPVRTIPLVIQDPDVSGVYIAGPQTNKAIQLVVAEGVFGDSYSIRLTTIPFALVTISLSCDQVRVGVFPSTLTFTPDDWNIRQAITVNATDDFIKQGTVDTWITHTVASDDPLYAKLAMFVVALRTIETADRTPAPMVQQIYFGDTGADLLVMFNRAVDQTNFTGATNFSCGLVFNVTVAGVFGDSPLCSWPNTKTIRVVLGKSPLVLPKDFVGLNGNVLKSTPDAVLSMASIWIQVDLPRKPLVPRISVSGALNLGSCDGLALNAKASSGSGGRQMTWQWTIDPPGLLDDMGLSNQSIAIPSDLLAYGGGYIVTLTLTNFFNMNAPSDNLVVTKASMPLPSVYIEGPSQVSLLRSQTLQLSSVAMVSTCGDATTNPSMGFLWSLNNVPVVSESRNPRNLKLSKLDRGSYATTVLVFMADTPEVNNTASVLVQINPSPLVAVIVGGNRTIGNVDDLLLNGTTSFDPDNSTTELSYTWKCTDFSTGRTSCNGLDIDNGDVTTVPRDYLPPKTTLLITLTVSDPSTGRQSNAIVSLTVVLGNPPITKILSLATTKFNPDAKIVLAGSVTSVLDTQPAAQWSIDGDSDGSLAASTFGLPVVEVSPAAGTTLATSFHISCTDWVDEDLPLKFSFKYIVGEYSIDGPQVTLSDYSLTTSFDTVFPTGGGPNNTITIVSYIADALGYTTQSITTVQVTLPTYNNDAEQAAFLQNQTSQLENLAASNDPGKVLNMVNILASMMVTPSTAANVTDTSESTPEPTTYVPAPTDSAGSPAPTPAPTRPPKRCSTAISGTVCSGHGTCTNNPPQCSDDILECTAICTCGSSWYGTDCNTSQEDYDKKQKMLGSLLNSMVMANANVEPTPQALEQQSSAVASITANVAVLSPTQQSQALDLVASILTSSSSVTLSPATTTAVGQSISSLLDAPPVATTSTQQRRRLDAQDTKSTRVGNTVSLLATSMLSDHEPGEAAVQMNTKNLKLTLQRHDASAIAKAIVQLPLSVEQVKRNYTSPSFGFPDNFSTYGGCASVDTHAALYASNLYSDESATAINSAVMGLNLNCGDAPMPVANLSKGFTIRMRNNKQYPMPSKPLNGTVQCVVNQPVVKNITCDLTNQLFKKGAWSSEGCVQVKDPDPAYIVCECNHLTDFSSQVNQALHAVEDNVVAVFTHKTTLEDVKQNLQVVVTMGVFFILYAAGLLYGMRRDRLDAVGYSQQQKKLVEGTKVDMNNLFQLPKVVNAKTKTEKIKALMREFWAGMSGKHQLLSIFLTYDPDFTRPQRLMIIFTTIMSQMLINAVLYRLRQLEPNVGTMLVSGLVSSVLMMPVTLAFVILFKKSAKKHEYMVRYQLEDSDNVIEVQVDAYGNPVEYTKFDVLRMDLQTLSNGIDPSSFQLCLRWLQRDGLDGPLIGPLSRALFLVLHGHDVWIQPESSPDESALVVKSTDHQKRKRMSSLFKAPRKSTVAIEDPSSVDKAVEKVVLPRLSEHDAMAKLLAMWGNQDLHNTVMKLEPTHLTSDAIAQLAVETNAGTGQLKVSVPTLPSDVVELRNCKALLEFCSKFHECAECFQSDAVAVLRNVQDQIRRANEELIATKQLLKSQLSQNMSTTKSLARRSITRLSRSSSNDHKTAALRAVKDQVKVVVHQTKRHMTQARTIRKEAQKSLTLQRKQMQKQAKADLRAVLANLNGLQRWKKRFELYVAAKESKRLAAMPLHERQLFLKEKEKLQNLRMTSRLLYNQFLRRQPQKLPKPLFPDWVNYVLYVMCACIDGFAGWFVLQFAFTIGGDLANVFIGSIVTGLVMTWVVSDPIMIFFKMGIMPVLATALLANTGIFEALSAETFVLGTAAAVGVAGVAKLRGKKASAVPIANPEAQKKDKKVDVVDEALARVRRDLDPESSSTSGPPSTQVLAAEMDAQTHVEYLQTWDKLHDPSTAVVDNSEEQKQRTVVVVRTGPSVGPVPVQHPDHALFPSNYIDMPSAIDHRDVDSSNIVPIGPSIDMVVLPFSDEDDDKASEVCQCGQNVPLASRQTHLAHDCSHRMVQCRNPGCSLFVQARGLVGHESSQCRLVLCPCGRMILKHKLRQHQESEECSAKVVTCRLGCGVSGLTVRTLDTHERTECALRPIECPACHIVTQARDQASHRLECCGNSGLTGTQPSPAVVVPLRVKGPALSMVVDKSPPSPQRRQLAPLRLTKRVYIAAADDTIDETKDAAAATTQARVSPLRLTGPPLMSTMAEARVQSGLASAAKSTLEERAFYKTQARAFLQENTRQTAFVDTEVSLFSMNASQPPKPKADEKDKSKVNNPYKLKPGKLYHDSDEDNV
ncbi:hypothetical protein DYB38_002118 [Aphanomyces astaci]|uniref:TRAF-type domain-containing protein n=1 Tax=Aphanomyces astaci TaxID=112090 RepID=A0A397E8B2_APHAT|nr:hypothetical protein DYB38_002118 [Aphanomyces astaci]